MITFLIAELEVRPGWAVGAVAIDDPAIDRDLLVDIDGRPWVPGSSLAGSLRAHLAASDVAAGTAWETALMGSRPPTSREHHTAASALWFLGTEFAPDPNASDAVVEVVGQTAIDRERGAAAAGPLRYSRTVSSGGTVTVYLRYDGTLSAAQLQTLAAWRPTLGRDRTTGGGRTNLRTLRHGQIDPTTPDGRRTWLTHDGPGLVEAVATHLVRPDLDQPPPWLSIELQIRDALLVGDPRSTGPAKPRVRGGRALVPGSAWKGLIRSRVEYILRSRYGEDAACRQPTGCGACATCDVFGHQGRRGRLSFTDSIIKEPAASSGSARTVRTQVGIDRVTGGARDGLLFQSMPVTAGRLTLRIELLEPVPEWVRTTILHTVRDLHDGLIGVGSRVTRGMGTLELVDPLTVFDGLGPVTVAELETRGQFHD